MSTGRSTSPPAHRCTGCGESFETTEALLEHARTVHRFSPR